MEINKIYNEDCLEGLKRIEDNSIDLIVTSPPYNKGIYSANNQKTLNDTTWNIRKVEYDVCEDNMDAEDYIRWQKNVIKECVRVLKPEGSLFYNHKEILYHKKSIMPLFVYDFNVHQTIIWNRKNSPSMDEHYFIPTNEYIFWIVKDENKTFFCRKDANFKTSIWDIVPHKSEHPAPFPLDIPFNCIKSCTKDNGIVLDPFMGSGTTAIAAIKTKRNYIGFELSPKYCEMANNRIREEQSQLSLF